MARKKMPYSSLSKTGKYYRKNKSAASKKNSYNTKFNKSSKQRKRRSELVTARRKRGMYGKAGDDLHHDKSGRLVKMNPHKNRGLKEKSRLKGSKRK